MRNLLIIVLLSISYKAFSCDCTMYSDPKVYISKVDLIFTGKVVELVKAKSIAVDMPDFFDTIPDGAEQWKKLNPDNYFYAKVVMTQQIKGGVSKTDTLFFTSNFTNCDPIYQLDQSYLFFAQKTDDGKYIMTPCTPWGILKESKHTIEALTK